MVLPAGSVERSDLSYVDNPDNAECPICFDSVVNGGIGHAPHWYHPPCLLEWLAHGHNECPKCRVTLIDFDSPADPFSELPASVQVIADQFLINAPVDEPTDTSSEEEGTLIDPSSYPTNNRIYEYLVLSSQVNEITRFDVNLLFEMSRAANGTREIEVVLNFLTFLETESETGFYKQVFQRAIEGGNIQAVEAFLQNRDLSFNASDLKAGIKCALKFTQPQLAEKLLDAGRLELTLEDLPRDPEEVQRVIEEAAEKNCRNLIREFERLGELSESRRSEAVVKASLRGNHDLVQYLLSVGSISDDARGRALILAALENYDSIAVLLFQNGPVSSEHLQSALHEARRNQNDDMTELLSSNSSFQTAFWVFVPILSVLTAMAFQ